MEQQGGITWLELFALYEIQGWRYSETREGRSAQWKKLMLDPTSAEHRWSRHQKAGGKKRQMPTAKFRKVQTTRE